MFEAQIVELPDDDNIQNFDMVADGNLLPFKTTYYQCQLFELPRLESKHHIIKVRIYVTIRRALKNVCK